MYTKHCNSHILYINFILIFYKQFFYEASKETEKMKAK